MHYKTELVAVQRVRQALFHTIDLDQLVETTLRIALDEVGTEAGSILLADPETEHLVFQYSIGANRSPGGPRSPGIRAFPGPCSNRANRASRTRWPAAPATIGRSTRTLVSSRAT